MLRNSPRGPGVDLPCKIQNIQSNLEFQIINEYSSVCSQHCMGHNYAKN